MAFCITSRQIEPDCNPIGLTVLPILKTLSTWLNIMGIRVKILLIIVAIFALLLVLAGVVLNHAVYTDLSRQEREDIVERAERLEELFSQQLKALSAPARDWSAWDDTYNYINKPNRHHESINLSAKTLDLVKFDKVVLWDASGKVRLHADMLGGLYNIQSETPPELVMQFERSRQNPLGECGILKLQTVPLLFCFNPVRSSEMKQPSNGFQLIGRYLMPSRMNELRLAMKQMLILHYERPNVSETLLLAGEYGPTRIGWNALGEKQYEIFKEIEGSDGKPAFWVRFVYERTRAEQSASIFARVLVWIVMALCAIVTFLYFLLERVLVRRLSRLEGVVGQASKNHDWGAVVPHSDDRDEIGRLANGIGTLFQEMAKNVSQLEAESLEDALTKLPNRRSFDQKLDFYWLVCQRHRQPLTIMMIDVDHFKRFNDLYGHQAGDDVLAGVAKALRTELYRTTDFIARYGGEEFAVILPDAGCDDAIKIAERLRNSVELLQIAHADGLNEEVTISIGLASCDVPRADWCGDDMLRNADIALYEAKADGRNCVKAVCLTFCPDD